MCQPVTLSANTTASYVTVDANNVYWIGGPFNPQNPNAVYVESCPKGGGCGTGTPLYESSSVAFGGLANPGPSSPMSGKLYTIETGCAAPSQFDVIGKNGGGLAAQASLNLYPEPSTMAFDTANSWVYMLVESVLMRVAPDGTNFSTFLGGLNVVAARQMSIDAQNVYVPDSGNNRVVYCPLAGTSCAIGTVMTGVSVPVAVYSDGTYVWVAAAGTSATTGAIKRCNVNVNCAGSPALIAGSQGSPSGIVADGTYAYWSNMGTGEIMRCAVGGCGGMPDVIAKVGGPTSITADATAIYWGDSGGIKKLAK
jgi:hypothetical protein